MKIAGLFFILLAILSGTAFAAENESVYDRVMRTGTIRCGYAVWPPSVVKEPNTGKMSGYSYDVMNTVGEKLGLKIDWAEETGWGTAEQSIISGKIDAMCADVCLDARRTRTVWYSMPFTHNPIYTFVRHDDSRFDDSVETLNSSDMSLAVIPNTILDYAAREKYPLAHSFDVNDLGGNIDVIMAVTTKKADASFNNVYSIEQFNKNNEDKLKTVGEPVRYCHGGFLLPQGDMNFKQMIDSAIYELNGSGTLRKILAKNSPDDGRHWNSPALPYEGLK
ncbi:MAG: ABC transporter substrate-binding protein [Micavibrio sp.]|nr:ABC transporter substrate-binding protein [Micavibrio sp.]